jgi:hypothetical protein
MTPPKPFADYVNQPHHHHLLDESLEGSDPLQITGVARTLPKRRALISCDLEKGQRFQAE